MRHGELELNETVTTNMTLVSINHAGLRISKSYDPKAMGWVKRPLDPTPLYSWPVMGA